MNFNMVSKKTFIKYDNVEKLYYELIILFIWLLTHATCFIVIARKPVVSALQKENAHYANFAVYFLQTME